MGEGRFYQRGGYEKLFKGGGGGGGGAVSKLNKQTNSSLTCMHTFSANTDNGGGGGGGSAIAARGRHLNAMGRANPFRSAYYLHPRYRYFVLHKMTGMLTWSDPAAVHATGLIFSSALIDCIRLQ